MGQAKKIIYFFSVVLLGAAGGAIGSRFDLPYFGPIGGSTVIERTKQVVVRENIALQTAIREAQAHIVGIKSTIKGKEVFRSGIVLTNDGVVAGPADLVLGSASEYWIRGSADWHEAELLGVDAQTRLALLRSKDALSLAPVTFVDPWKLNLGERVFSLAMPEDGTFSAYEGYISRKEGDLFTDTVSQNIENGAVPLFTMEKKVLGLILSGSRGQPVFLPAEKISAFMREVLLQ